MRYVINSLLDKEGLIDTVSATLQTFQYPEKFNEKPYFLNNLNIFSDYYL